MAVKDLINLTKLIVLTGMQKHDGKLIFYTFFVNSLIFKFKKINQVLNAFCKQYNSGKS